MSQFLIHGENGVNVLVSVAFDDVSNIWLNPYWAAVFSFMHNIIKVKLD